MITLMNSQWAQEWEVFPEEREEIEALWGEALESDMMFIGGPDWPAWGTFRRHAEDPLGIIRGKARDRMHSYEGRYVAESGNYDVSQGIDYGAFEISGLDNERVLLHRRDQAPPIDYFFLVPVEPQALRRRSFEE